MALVEIKDFNALIDHKPVFDYPVKNKQETYEKRIEISKNDDYTTGNLLDYLYHQKYYKLISTDLSRQTSTNISQEIIMWENQKKMMVQECFLLLKSSKKLF